MPAGPQPTKINVSPRLAMIAGACAVVGAIFVGLIASAARGCGRGGREQSLELRVARIEAKLGMSAEAGASEVASASSPAAPASAGAVQTPECAVAKVAAYEAWDDARVKAKAVAGPAEAACNDMWSSSRKQSCYYTASAGVRTAQAARDAVIKGGTAARDAVKNVKDDPKNDALAPARAASEAAFTACHDENEL